MRDRGFLKDAVAEIEDVRASGEGVKDTLDGRLQTLAAREERQGVEIALDRKLRRKLRVRPDRVDRLVETDRVDARLARIGRELATRALGKADEADMRDTAT